MRNIFWIALIALVLFPTGISFAGPYEYDGPWIAPSAGDIIPEPCEVPGKEYTDRNDKNDGSAPSAVPMQTLHWDGYNDGFNPGAGRENGVYFDIDGFESGEIDALAHNRDALFDGIINNLCPIIVSTVGDKNWDNTTDYPLLYEKASGLRDYWCVDSGVIPNRDGVDQEGVNDLDAVELWHSPTGQAQTGNTDGTDSNRFSVLGDLNGVAVYDANGDAVFTDNQLGAAIADLMGLLPQQETDLIAGMDVDAIMVDETTDDRLLFSISALTITDYSFVGDEVWLYNATTNTATWLNHGGHLWDTNWTDDIYEHSFDIDALEAVPEPCTLCLLGISGIFALCRKKR